MASRPAASSSLRIVDPDEPVIPGAEYILLDSDREELDRTTSDNQGVWSFDGLLPGDYFIQQVQPGDFRDGLDSVTGDIGEVIESDLFFGSLASGENATGLNSGELPLQPSKRSLLASRFRNLDDEDL